MGAECTICHYRVEDKRYIEHAAGHHPIELAVVVFLRFFAVEDH